MELLVEADLVPSARMTDLMNETNEIARLMYQTASKEKPVSMIKKIKKKEK